MTSTVTRDDVEGELWKLAGRRPSGDIRKFMRLVDLYAVTVGRKLGGTDEDWTIDKWAHLKPGETDSNAGMRRCAACGKVRNLYGAFEKEARAPYGRRLRCTSCREPKWRSRNRGRPDRYFCRKCKGYKPISAFPAEKRKTPKLLFHCLECQGS